MLNVNSYDRIGPARARRTACSIRQGHGKVPRKKKKTKAREGKLPEEEREKEKSRSLSHDVPPLSLRFVIGMMMTNLMVGREGRFLSLILDNLGLGHGWWCK